ADRERIRARVEGGIGGPKKRMVAPRKDEEVAAFRSHRQRIFLRHSRNQDVDSLGADELVRRGLSEDTRQKNVGPGTCCNQSGLRADVKAVTGHRTAGACALATAV